MNGIINFIATLSNDVIVELLMAAGANVINNYKLSNLYSKVAKSMNNIQELSFNEDMALVFSKENMKDLAEDIT